MARSTATGTARPAAGAAVTAPAPLVLVEDPSRPGDAPTRTAFDVRTEHRVLAGFSDDELARIPLVREGIGLRRFRIYLDLRDPGRADFAAEGDETVRPGQRIIARDDVHRPLWEALRSGCLLATGARRRSA